MPPTLSNKVDGAGLLFGQVKKIEIIEILATFPPKAEVDKLICQFFARENFPITVPRKFHGSISRICDKPKSSPAILHESTFMREV